MKYRWSLAASEPKSAASIAAELCVSPLLAQCLFNRGLHRGADAASFLQPRLKQLADPFLLPGMEEAVRRLLTAREQGEPLVIFGDYDVDGVTSVALLTKVLGALGWKIHYYLPHRFEEGYGLSREGCENCLAQFPVKLLLAVDCGSTAAPIIQELRERGIDVIVLDHHQVGDPVPNAVALVNPKVSNLQRRQDGLLGAPASLPARVSPTLSAAGSAGHTAPFSELCSAGLSFKLAHALLKRMREQNIEIAQQVDLRDDLDLVALGTIADLVPLTGENRILVSAGLTRLGTTRRPGIIALKTIAQTPPLLGCYDVAFQLAPRLNAAGRLENAAQSLHLLLAPNLAAAEPLARSLDAQNRERQTIERGIAEEAIATIRARFNAERDFAIVHGNASWHLGVVGIVASRVLQEFYRPTIILGGDGSQWRGSGRSIEGFDLAAALRKCDDLLVRHGGHAMAAGITIEPEKLDLFRARLNELARSALAPEQLQPSLALDAEVALHDMTLERLEELERLNPTGQGNPSVKLVIRGLSHQQPPQRMGKAEQHVKFRVTDGTRILEAVWWNAGASPLPKVRFDLAFTPQINEYNGRRSVQLKVIDWRSPSP